MVSIGVPSAVSFTRSADSVSRSTRVMFPLLRSRLHYCTVRANRRRQSTNRLVGTGAFWRITLPLLMPGILSGLVLSFIISLDDFVTTFFVGGAGSTTLPIYIFGLIKVGVTPEVNAISSLMLVISLVLVSLSLFLSSRRD